MAVRAAMPSSVRSRHLPLKGGDRFEFAAARLEKKSVYRSCSVGGDQWHGELPIFPFKGETSAKPPEGRASHQRLSIRKIKDVH